VFTGTTLKPVDVVEMADAAERPATFRDEFYRCSPDYFPPARNAGRCRFGDAGLSLAVSLDGHGSSTPFWTALASFRI
jgi:hypothetical protein